VRWHIFSMATSRASAYIKHAVSGAGGSNRRRHQQMTAGKGGETGKTKTELGVALSGRSQARATMKSLAAGRRRAAWAGEWRNETGA
jgi:hypothetical protein